MKASFGKGIAKKLRPSRTVWMADATYKDQTGQATFSSAETKQLTAHLSKAGSLFRTIPSNALNKIRDNEELKQKIKTYNNSFVREGVPFPKPTEHAKGLYNYIQNWYQKEIDKKKTQKGKDVWIGKRDAVMKDVFSMETFEQFLKDFEGNNN